MELKENIHKNREDTFKVLDAIKEVKVNHFFKHKVMQQLENQKVEKSKTFSWFTPQFQLATLGLLLLLNASAVFYAYSSQESISNNSLENFAQEYDLQSETISILN
jgi:hypothetical protein